MRIITTTEELAEYAADRKATLMRGETTLKRSVRRGLQGLSRGEKDWYTALVKRAKMLARQDYHSEVGRYTSQALRAALDDFEETLVASLEKTGKPTFASMDTQVDAIAASISTAAHNIAMQAAAVDLPTPEKELGKTWLSMDDDDVRPAHREADGQKVPLNAKFTVGGVEMAYPGDSSAPIDLWINCRCVLGIEYLDIEKAVLAGGEKNMPDDIEPDDLPGLDEEQRVAPDEGVAWYGVLAPEDVVSGDGRKFAKDALRHRDLPLPLSYQKVNSDGHDGSVVVGRIESIWRQDGQMRARGMFLSTPEADEAVGMLAEGGIRGVSVDADDGTMEMQTKDGGSMDDFEPQTIEDLEQLITVFTDARICGATLCAIPAFQEAFVALGSPPDEFMPGEPGADIAAGLETVEFRSVSEKPWDGSSSRFTDEEWFHSTIAHLNGNSKVKSDNKLPILEPGGALSRAAVHNAAARINQLQAPPDVKSKAKASLRTAYRELGDELPDVLKATEEVEEFVDTKDGPGWYTHPVDTERLARYWTRGKGAAKIGWGVPGDFNRCRTQLAKYIKSQYLSGYCANRHYDALGFWPGRPTSAETIVASGDAVAIHLVDIEAGERPPADWFADPHLTGPSPIVVTEDRRIFGHLATWGVCHIGIDKVCTTAPESATDYAYFRTGAVLTTEGEVPVGHITMGTGHAPQRSSAASAVGHYDNTGFCVADVAAGEDEHGIWVAGLVRPTATETQVYELRSAVLSGDWRELGGNLELVAALAVNVGGFPIPRTSMAASGGRQISLVAAGLVHRDGYTEKLDINAIVSAAIDEYEARGKRRGHMAELRMKAHRDPRSRMEALAGRRG
jgi:hypothetical protein